MVVISMTVTFTTCLQKIRQEHIDHFNDLVVLFDEKLTFREHMHQKINKAYSMFKIIK